MNNKTNNISSEDLAKINELRSLVANEITPYYNTDFNLLRWLKGHNNNINELLPKFKNHLLLRNSHFQLDKIANEQRRHPIHRYWKNGLTEIVNEKIPNTFVNVEQTGTNDYWGILNTFPINEIMKARIYDLEKMLKNVMDLEKKTGKQASILYIMDLNGLKYDKNLITLLTGPLASISTFISDNYVELIHNFVLVGVPSFISTIWSVAKPLLPERTRNKVLILGSNWRQEILKLASSNTLPQFWNNKDDLKYTANIEKSIPVNVNDYYKKTNNLKNKNICTINAGKFDFIRVYAEKNQKITWFFETDGNFAYGLYYSENSNVTNLSNMLPVYPRFSKVPGPTYVPISDSITSEKTGTYNFWFSNEHAWLHTLHVYYNITVA